MRFDSRTMSHTDPTSAQLPAAASDIRVPVTGKLFEVRPYALFWTSRLLAQSASQMVMVAVGWQMYERTGSAWDLGLVGLAQFLPALLLTLPAGHLADHHRRSRIVMVATVTHLLGTLILLAATYTGRADRTLILQLSLLFGVAKAFQAPASQALTPGLVPVSLLPRALAFNASGFQVATIGGPALAGALVAIGLEAVYGLAALSLTVGAVLLAPVRTAKPVPSGEGPGWATLLAGVTFIVQRPVLLGAISLDLFAVLLGGATALLPIFVKDILHAGPWALGLLRAAPAAGALLMSLWLARHPLHRRVGRWLFASVAIYGLCMLVFGSSGQLWLSWVALLLSGAADMVSVVIRQTLVQLETPDAMRGRVSAVNSVFIGASNQLGEFESGATAAWLGPVGSVLLGGVGVLAVAALWIRWFPPLWQRDRLTLR